MSSQEKSPFQFVAEEEAVTPRGKTERTLLFHFPSLEKLLAQPAALANLRAQLTRTSQDLERVIRQGSNQDAAAAQRAYKAWQLTLTVLTEIEREAR